MELIFLIVSRAVSLLRLSRRESWWKDAEILMLRHQLSVAHRGQDRGGEGVDLEQQWRVGDGLDMSVAPVP